MQRWGQRLLPMRINVTSDILRIFTFIWCVCATAHGGRVRGQSVGLSLSDHQVGPEIKLGPLEVRSSGTFIH